MSPKGTYIALLS